MDLLEMIAVSGSNLSAKFGKFREWGNVEPHSEIPAGPSRPGRLSWIGSASA